jgi:16S rRNA (guanine527-N7)-methyltransferase
LSLKSLLEKNSLNFEDIFYKDCEVFVELLQKWGKVHNLSGRLSDDDIYENILDSLYPLNFIDEFNSFADIGTGAGYPGLILAIARKDVSRQVLRSLFRKVLKDELHIRDL